MRACELFYTFLFASIGTASSDCEKDPYEPISQLEFGYLKGLLSRYVRPMLANNFTKQPPQKGQLMKRESPPQGMGNLGFANDGAFLSTPTTPKGGSDNENNEQSISERVYSNWCTVVTNACIPEADNQDKTAGLLWMIVNHGEPKDQNTRRNAILEMLKETQTAGAVTFKDVWVLTKLKVEPPTPGPKEDITLNVAMQWRDNVLPRGTPTPKLVIKLFPPPRPSRKQAPRPPPKAPPKSHHKRLYRLPPSAQNPPTSGSARSILRPRDDLSDNFCFPKNIDDWHILLLQLFTSIVLERMAPLSPPDDDPSKAPTTIELDIVHPGVGGRYDIVSGGQVRVKFWLSDSGPDYKGLRGAYFATEDAAPNSFSDEPPPGGSLDQTCYENYVAADAAPDSQGPSKIWKTAYGNACLKAFGGKDIDDEKLPRPFRFVGPGPGTKGKDGRGWRGEFIPDRVCNMRYSCGQLMDLLEEHLAFCVGKVQDEGVYHGGVKHLRAEDINGARNCGTMRFSPMGVKFTDVF